MDILTDKIIHEQKLKNIEALYKKKQRRIF